MFVHRRFIAHTIFINIKFRPFEIAAIHTAHSPSTCCSRMLYGRVPTRSYCVYDGRERREYIFSFSRHQSTKEWVSRSKQVCTFTNSCVAPTTTTTTTQIYHHPDSYLCFTHATHSTHSNENALWLPCDETYAYDGFGLRATSHTHTIANETE